MASSEQKPSGFTVTDRRSFAGAAEAPPPQAQGEAPPPPPEPGNAESSALPPVDFTTFVLSLSSSALMHLGEVERPETGKAERNLPLAKHTIDLLSLLQEKTRGNLTAQEDKLLESLLFDLRLRYVSAAKAK
jgi:hypothetical protein